jgi:4-hydroxybenzoate polyprenyltransferase
VSGITSLIRLSRPGNLLIMGLTMYALRHLIMEPLLRQSGLGIDFRLSEGLFFISCLVMICLGAAGNIINDYFDRKVDAVNKPEKLIVGRLVKRRVAMILHQALNIMAVLLAVVVCWQTDRWSGMLFPVIIATILWWYSPVLKKTAFYGNLVVGLMVAVLPVWTGYFEIPLLREAYADMMSHAGHFFLLLWSWLAGYALFAFLLTLAREAAKDLEDLEGDRLGGYRTLPIVWGEPRTIRYIRNLLAVILLLVAAGSTVIFNPLDPAGRYPLLASMLLIWIPLLVCIRKCSRAADKRAYASLSRWLKVVMAGGIAFTWFAGEWITAVQ